MSNIFLLIGTQTQCDELWMTPGKCKHTSTRLGSHRTESESINSLRRDSPSSPRAGSGDVSVITGAAPNIPSHAISVHQTLRNTREHNHSDH